ncbi:MAG: STAS domain-containing protein [Methylocystaceae bacterium]|nr:STAS domain-containing protein [Methylocystaceae bacterium]
MQYTLSENPNDLSVLLTGELTLNDEEEFRALCRDVVETSRSKCIIDVTQLEFLDSAGLGLLLVLKEFCEDAGKTIALKVGDSAIKEILDISEFDSLIPYEDA